MLTAQSHSANSVEGRALFLCFCQNAETQFIGESDVPLLAIVLGMRLNAQNSSQIVSYSQETPRYCNLRDYSLSRFHLTC